MTNRTDMYCVSLIVPILLPILHGYVLENLQTYEQQQLLWHYHDQEFAVSTSPDAGPLETSCGRTDL